MPRKTIANTTYTEMSDEDFEIVKAVLMKVAAVICESSNSTSEEGKEAFKEFNKRTKELPKGKNGLNTIASFTGGVINNIVFGTQRDFTVKQLDGIEYVTAALSSYVDDVPLLTFGPGLL
jgi:hypothetical protein